MLAAINDIDVMYLNYVIRNLEKEEDEYIRGYWLNELKNYMRFFEQKLLGEESPTPSSPSFDL